MRSSASIAAKFCGLTSIACMYASTASLGLFSSLVVQIAELHVDALERRVFELRLTRRR